MAQSLVSRGTTQQKGSTYFLWLYRTVITERVFLTKAVPVNTIFLPGKIYVASEMLLATAPPGHVEGSVYSATIESVGWLCVGDLSSTQQRIMKKKICPELTPLLASEGLIFPDLTEAQMCLHESSDMLLYLWAFEINDKYH
jgi:hypothetical protein